MFRVSMTRLKDSFSRLKSYLSEKKQVFYERAEVKRRKYVWTQEYSRWKRYVVENVKAYVKGYGKYVLFEFAPYVLAYGLMINIPLNVLLAMALTWKTVLSWGLAFYLVESEFTSIVNDIIPYVKVTAKVDN